MANCSLCKLPKTLKNSHLIPKSIYHILKKSFDGNDLVMSDSDKETIFYSDNQIKAHFLCEECEEKLNRFGENAVIPQCFKGSNEFILLDKISSATQFLSKGSEKWINPKIEDNFYDKEYLYFAASIFWRASAWSSDIGNYKGSLGPKYEEQFRKFLMGEEGFPENAYLAVFADRATDKFPIIIFPSATKKHGYHHHVFYIPGVKFSLILGAKVDNVRKLSIQGNTKIFFVEYNFSEQADFALLTKQVKNKYIPSGRLKKDSSS